MICRKQFILKLKREECLRQCVILKMHMTVTRGASWLNEDLKQTWGHTSLTVLAGQHAEISSAGNTLQPNQFAY